MNKSVTILTIILTLSFTSTFAYANPKSDGLNFPSNTSFKVSTKKEELSQSTFTANSNGGGAFPPDEEAKSEPGKKALCIFSFCLRY